MTGLWSRLWTHAVVFWRLLSASFQNRATNQSGLNQPSWQIFKSSQTLSGVVLPEMEA